MTQTVAQFSERCIKAASVMKVAEREMVRSAALVVTLAERRQIGEATGDSMKLSGVGLKGARVNAGFLMLPASPPAALVTARGPLHLLERPTKAHTVKARRRLALKTPDGLFARVQVPGTKGKYPWAKGVAEGVPLAEAAAIKGARKAAVGALIG